MAHTRSAEKNMRQTAKRRLRNRSMTSTLKTAIAGFRAAAGAGEALGKGAGPDAARAQALLREVVRRVDQACAKGTLHRNTAARRKSALMRLAAASQKKA